MYLGLDLGTYRIDTYLHSTMSSSQLSKEAELSNLDGEIPPSSTMTSASLTAPIPQQQLHLQLRDDGDSGCIIPMVGSGGNMMGIQTNISDTSSFLSSSPLY